MARCGGKVAAADAWWMEARVHAALSSGARPDESLTPKSSHLSCINGPNIAARSSHMFNANE
jgi:hypothetical protein